MSGVRIILPAPWLSVEFFEGFSAGPFLKLRILLSKSRNATFGSAFSSESLTLLSCKDTHIFLYILLFFRAQGRALRHIPANTSYYQKLTIGLKSPKRCQKGASKQLFETLKSSNFTIRICFATHSEN